MTHFLFVHCTLWFFKFLPNISSRGSTLVARIEPEIIVWGENELTLDSFFLFIHFKIWYFPMVLFEHGKQNAEVWVVNWRSL